ncbi:MAG: hypothetical protein JW829_04505 [Pirellulales bacterium]|nr:hypothetical protein [Pirellulales bacterium]
MLHGISQRGNLFCLDAQNGKSLWTESLSGRGFGSIVYDGSVFIALTPEGELTVFEPSRTEYNKVASYEVADSEIYAYPIPTGSGIYIKDQDSVTHWGME